MVSLTPSLQQTLDKKRRGGIRGAKESVKKQRLLTNNVASNLLTPVAGTSFAALNSNVQTVIFYHFATTGFLCCWQKFDSGKLLCYESSNTQV